MGLRPVPGALASRAAGWDRLMTFGLFLAAGLLGLGLVLPVLETSRFFLFSDQVSLVHVVQELWVESQFFLSIVIAAWSIVFPMLKLLAATYLWRHTSITSVHFPRVLALIDFLGRWSLGDVFVVALVIVVIKSSGVVNATMGVGLYPFTASIVLTALLVARLKQLARREAARGA